MKQKSLKLGFIILAGLLAVGCTKKSSDSSVTDLNPPTSASGDTSAKPADSLVLPKGMGSSSLGSSLPGPRNSMGNIQAKITETNHGSSSSKAFAKAGKKKHHHKRRHGKHRRQGRRHHR